MTQEKKAAFILAQVLKRKHDLRLIMDAIFYINKTGVQWRNLNFKNPFFPKWQIVYYYFRTWKKLGVFIKTNEKLVGLERLRQEKESLLSANLIDSQFIKISPFIPDDKGIDGGKKVNGCKRHVITDTLGLVIAVVVTAANVHDAKAGVILFNLIKNRLKNTKCFFGDNRLVVS